VNGVLFGIPTSFSGSLTYWWHRERERLRWVGGGRRLRRLDGRRAWERVVMVVRVVFILAGPHYLG
jgi:hypothetical protein